MKEGDHITLSGIIVSVTEYKIALRTESGKILCIPKEDVKTIRPINGRKGIKNGGKTKTDQRAGD